MSGLLNPQVDGLTLGLLGLSQRLLTPRQMGGGIGAGMQGMAGGLLQGQQMQRQAAQDALRMQLYGAQMERYKADAEKDKATAAKEADALRLATERREAQKEILAGLGGPRLGFRDENIAITGNAPPGYVPPQQGRITITPEIAARWAANGGDMKTLREIAESPDFGRLKVEGTLEAADAQGRPTSQMRDAFGGFIGAPVPKPYQKQLVNTGGAQVGYDPYTLGLTGASIANTQTPDGKASNAVAWANVENTRRGQDLTDSRARERFAFDQRQAAAPVEKWVTDLAGGRQVNERTGEARPITQDGKPVGARNDDAGKRVQNAQDALKIITEADGLLDKSTSGYIGTGVDKAAQMFGIAPSGAVAGGQLKTLQAALMMRMPRMEGPQSNLDVALYRESVGQIGDTTVPLAIRKAALATVKRLQEQYAGIEPTNTVDFKNVGRQSASGTINFSDLK